MLGRSRYGNVGTIRAYFDIVQYAKAIGYVKRIWNHSSIPTIDDSSSPYDYNPSKVETYVAYSDNDSWNGHHIGFNCEFKNRNNLNKNFAELLKSTNYFGVFGHNLHTSPNFRRIGIGFYGSSNSEGIMDEYASPLYPLQFNGIVGTIDDTGNGYTISEITGFDSNDDGAFEGVKVYLYSDTAGDGAYVSGENEFKVGSISVGRFMDFPQSANLNMNIKYNYDGIKSKNTTSGRTITNVRYYKPPDWGPFPRWTHVPSDTLDLSSSTNDDWMKNYDFRTVGATGRRSWDLSWSFLSKEDVFPRNSEGNMFAQFMDTATGGGGIDVMSLKNFDNIIGTMMTLTLGGNIPFLFQPDKEKQDFAYVKIDRKSISIRQSAPELYSVSLKLTEVW